MGGFIIVNLNNNICDKFRNQLGSGFYNFVICIYEDNEIIKARPLFAI